MTDRLMQWNASNTRVLAFWGLAAGLYAFYLMGHNPISNICYALRDTYTESVYRHTLQIIGKVLLGLFVLWLAWRLLLTGNKLAKTSVWLIFGGLLANYYGQLVKITIEYVHFIQYCGLTLLVALALNGRVFVALVICLAAGFLDEVYQTFGPVSPLNWRDVSLNVIGVVWGGMVWWTLKTDTA
jgi:VanZ family protein